MVQQFLNVIVNTQISIDAAPGVYINPFLPTLSKFPSFSPDSFPQSMDEPTALHCRNAALETELRLVKDQLTQAQNGGTYLVNLLGRQVTQPAHLSEQQQEVADLRSQLKEALQCNAQLEQLLTASRRVRAALQQRERNLDKAFRALKERVGNDGEVIGALGYGRKDIGKSFVQNDSATRFKGEELKGRENWILNSAAKDHESVASSDEDELAFGGSMFQPADSTEGKPKEVDADAPSHPDEMPKGKTIYWGPNGGGLLGNETQHIDLRPSGAVIQGSNGDTFVVSNPSPRRPDKNAPAAGALSRRGLSTAYPAPRPFTSNQHNRLAGVACWVEELNEIDYYVCWQKYAREHLGHTPAEWQAYYEAEVRPLWYDKQIRAEREKAPSPDGRKDSKIAKSAEEEDDGPEDVSSPTEGKIEETSSLDERMKEEEALIDLGADVEDNGNATVSEKAQSLELGAGGSLGHDSDVVLLKCGVSDEPSNDDEPMLTSIVASIEIDQTEECMNIATQSRLHEDNEDSTERQSPEAVELRTARPVHFRSYSKEEVKQRDIPSRGSSGNHQISTEPLNAQVQVFVPTASNLPQLPHEPAKRSFNQAEDTRWQGMVSYLGNSPNPELRRTVCIGDIPVGTTLAEVLDQVSCGRIISAKFIDTAGMKTSPSMQGNTVLIEFFGHHNAQRYRDICSQYPLSLPLPNGTQHNAHVSLVTTPTRPIPGFLIGAIRENGHSRVIYVHDFRHEMTAEYVIAKCCLDRQGRGRAWEVPKLPIRQHEAQGLVTLEFAGIEEARRAYVSLCYGLEFSGMQKGFLPDPCLRGREMGDGEVEAEAEAEAEAL